MAFLLFNILTFHVFISVYAYVFCRYEWYTSLCNYWNLIDNGPEEEERRYM
jgi:hypothetical protein